MTHDSRAVMAVTLVSVPHTQWFECLCALRAHPSGHMHPEISILLELLLTVGAEILECVNSVVSYVKIIHIDVKHGLFTSRTVQLQTQFTVAVMCHCNLVLHVTLGTVFVILTVVDAVLPTARTHALLQVVRITMLRQKLYRTLGTPISFWFVPNQQVFMIQT